MIRLLLADDQDSFRQDLAMLLSLEEDLEIVGEASDGKKAIQLSQQLQPDVILMDVRMPVCDGVAATQEIYQRSPWIRILVLTMFDDDEYICKSLQAGALGYLLKRTPAKQIAIAVRSVYLGYGHLSPSIASKVFSQLQPKHQLTDVVEQYNFTKRELDVLKLIGQGKNNQEIAQILYLSEGTVRNYISQVINQLEMRDRTQVALWAQKYFLNYT